MTKVLAFVSMMLLALPLRAAESPASRPSSDHIAWTSATTGGAIDGHLLVPDAIKQDPSKPAPVVIYLSNLSTPRVGQEPDEPILNDLVKDGDLVLVLDYARNAKAVSPEINADALKLRTDISKKQLLADYKVDLAHVFILAEGCRLKRDVEFNRDGKRVMGMDIAYPSKPTKPSPMLMEFTCDNKDRMGTSSLLFCHDTLVDGGTAAGFAVAMADHPVAPPYKGLDDPMPMVVYALKAAVRTYRSVSYEIGGNGQIGVIGFSRGGPMAAILAVSNGRDDLEGEGPHRDISSAVQAALVHGNRYDYIDLLPNDPMLARFEKAWGKRDENEQKWAAHGASYYLPKDGKSVAPMFLNTSDAESPEYRNGLAQFDQRLMDLGVEHVYQIDADGRGHRVSTDLKTLASIYAFFAMHLKQ
jgi:hypothetical protein